MYSINCKEMIQGKGKFYQANAKLRLPIYPDDDCISGVRDSKCQQ